MRSRFSEAAVHLISGNQATETLLIYPGRLRFAEHPALSSLQVAVSLKSIQP